MIEAKIPTIQFVMPSASPDPIKQIVINAQGIIRDRTKSGKDVNYNDFEKYSEKYREKKMKSRTSRGVQNVDLRDTATMMRSLDKKEGIRGIYGGYEIYIIDDNRKMIGWIHNEGVGKMPKREWMGLNDADVTMLEQKYIGKREFIK